MKRIKPRPLVASHVVKATPRQVGGGRPRAALVEKAKASIAKGSKSFAVASMLLDRTTRERTHLLYAWCRRCDDIADGQDHGGELSLDKASALDRVEAIRILTHRALDGQPTADVAFDALGQVASEVGLTRQMADDVIDGFQLDAEGWRPRSEADLMRYCYHVAGAVGVMMAQVMGVPADAEDTLDRACDLGLAFQLNNIVRDIWEDDAAGRCYIPEEWLVEADIPPGQHMKVTNRDALVAIVQRMVDMARLHDAHARIGAGHLAFRQRWAILAAANIYGEIGREVVAQGPAAWDHRVHTGSLQKLGLVGAGLVEAVSGSYPPEAEPVWTRGKLIALARKDRPAPDIRETPLPDEGVRPA